MTDSSERHSERAAAGGPSGRAAGRAAGAKRARERAPEPAPEGATSERAPESVDIVVVGAGGAGLAAALTAAQAGATVAVFEKQAALGGTTRFAEGMFAVESEIQRADYVAMTRDEAFQMIMEYSHWRANARLVRAFVDESAGTIAWLQRQGVAFVGVKPMWPDSLRVWHVLEGPVHARARPMVNKLAAAAKDLGAEIHLKSRVVSLLREGGKISGVVVEERSGARREVRARAVVIASGGYSNDPELIKRYTGFDLGENVFPISNTGKDGDGIRMAWDAGAAEEGMGVLQLTGGGPIGAGFDSALASKLAWISCFPGLWLNAKGERFCDESTSYYFPHLANAIARQPGSFAFAVFDEAQERDMAERGVDFSMGMFLQPGTRLEGLRETLEEAQEKGNPNVMSADSLTQLADLMGVDEERLGRALDEYNACCEQRRDPVFAKDAKYLFPVRGPRFHAIRCSLGFLSTLGGIKIDDRTRAIDGEDEVIPGLYAAGVDAGGLYGDSYDLCAAGSTLGFAVTSGRIAGREAAAYALWAENEGPSAVGGLSAAGHGSLEAEEGER